MHIGYVGDSTIHPFHSASRFRLASYTPEKFLETAKKNLDGVLKNVEYASESGLLFYRLRSEVIPFASHPVCTENWQNLLKDQLEHIGNEIRAKGMRVSTHPDQFVVLNSPSESVVSNSIKELEYHADLFDAMKLSSTHKIQIHVGGVYGDKEAAIGRFIGTYHNLPQKIRNRLVIENDDKLFTVNDCYQIHEATTIPILFDNFHFSLNNNGEPMIDVARRAFSTWKEEDGIPMTDYSSQAEGCRTGRHADAIDTEQFTAYLEYLKEFDFDIMLEIKDKDKSALRAKEIIDSCIPRRQ